jgi:P4 family phage/plasmid primase-like protien
MLIEQTGGVTTSIRDADQSELPHHFNLSIAEVKAPVEPGATGSTSVATLDREVAIAEYAAEGFIILPCCPDAPSTAIPGGKSDQKAPRQIRDGKPRRLSQSQQQATDHELLATTDGVGIVPTGDVVILDLDTKNADHYGGVDAVRQALVEKNPVLATAPTERTQSGGLHIICRLSQWPGGYKNWRLESDGPELGEVRGAGSFTVVAPTSGYERLNEWGELPVLESLDGVFIGPRKNKPQAKAAKAAAGESTEAAGQFLPLRGLISKRLQPLLNGDFGDDASLALSKLYRDAHGWANLLKDMGVATDDPEALYLEACAACDCSYKAEAMVKGIKPGDCITSLEEESPKGIDACRDRINGRLALKKHANKPTVEGESLTANRIAKLNGRYIPLMDLIEPNIAKYWRALDMKSTKEGPDRDGTERAIIKEAFGCYHQAIALGVATDNPWEFCLQGALNIGLTQEDHERTIAELEGELESYQPYKLWKKGEQVWEAHLEKMVLKHSQQLPPALPVRAEGEPESFLDWDSKGAVQPKPSRVARMLSEEWDGKYIYLRDERKFYRYEAEKPGVWSPVEEEEIGGVIQRELDNRGMLDEYDHRFVTQVSKLIRERILIKRPKSNRSLVAYKNCVVNVLTKEVKQHSPENYIFWTLPYDYNPAIQLGPIEQFLKDSLRGDEGQIALVRAFALATLLGRSDLQKYMETVGPGGTGKGTFMRLIIALVGQENVHTTNLHKLEKNRFELGSLVDKALLVITDSDRYGGSVDVLKALTGSDSINVEKKGVQSYSYFPNLMVLIAANETLQSTDNTSGLARRRITLPFKNEIAADKKEVLLELDNSGVYGKFAAYLPGFANWVLGMPVAEMEDLVRNHTTRIASLGAVAVETLIESNTLAAWADDNLILVEGASTKVGGNQDGKKNEWLYPNYVNHAQENGVHPVSSVRFSGLLEDLFKSQLKIKGVTKEKDRRGSFFTGIALRDGNESQPRPISETKNAVNPHYSDEAGEEKPGESSVQTSPTTEPAPMSREHMAQPELAQQPVAQPVQAPQQAPVEVVWGATDLEDWAKAIIDCKTFAEYNTKVQGLIDSNCLQSFWTELGPNHLAAAHRDELKRQAMKG